MIIGLDKKKYRKSIRTSLMSVIAFYAIFIMVIYSLSQGRELDYQAIIILTITFLLGIVFTILLRHFLSVRKHKNCAVSYENGELNDHTKHRNRIRGLKIENIQSVSYWGKEKKINQYKIKTTASDPKSSPLMNQLKGGDYYLTDYLVDSKELRALAELVANDVAKITSQRVS